MKKDTDNREDKLRELLGKNENTFSVPTDYFEKLPGEIMDKINTLPDFEKSAVTNPFKVPDNYFEKLPIAVSEKIAAGKSSFLPWLNFMNRPRFVIPAAFATIVILAGLFFFTQRNTTTPFQEITFEDLKNSTYLQSMDEDLFVEVLSAQNEITSDESLEQYLIDNNIDLSQIENKL